MQCSAFSKSTGERCKGPAMRGSRVCRLHGGASPQARAAAARRLAEAEAKQAAAEVYVRHAGKAPDSPLEALKALAARFHAVEADLFAQIASKPDQMATLLPAWGASAAKYLDVLLGWSRIEPPPHQAGTIAELLGSPEALTFTLNLGGDRPGPSVPPPPALPPAVTSKEPDPLTAPFEPASDQGGDPSASVKERRAEADQAEAEVIASSPWRPIPGTDLEEA
jgi:hypothetical protein